MSPTPSPKEAKAKGIKVTEQGLDGTTTKNYGPIAQTIASSGDDTLFYAGYDAQAALLAKALERSRFKGTKVGGNGIKSSVFRKGSGAAGNGWYMTCGCADATTLPTAKAFNAAYQAKFHDRAVDVLPGGVRRDQPAHPGDQEGRGRQRPRGPRSSRRSRRRTSRASPPRSSSRATVTSTRPVRS